MTIFGPDVSGYQAGLQLAAGTPYVAAKATEGTGFTDFTYADFKAQAGRIGALFSAYHFLRPGGAAAQAAHAYSVVGKTALFLDWEGVRSPATGVYTSAPTMADATGFVDAYRALGGVVWATYLPHWYWSDPAGLGSVSLAPIVQRGLALISSDYTSYSDTGPGWAAYGGMTPQLWQYTDSQPYAGQGVDFNAYRGTLAELGELITGGTMALTDTDADLILNREIPRAGAGESGPTTLGEMVAWNDAHVQDIVNEVKALGVKLDALKLGGVDLAALEALIESHLASGSTPGVIAAAVLQHLSVATAGAKP